ncbi:MAG TPA: hypothetical protein PLH93_05780 [Flavobacteriales bacterium]|nr:hypothetical protein [Flavobacteriales bacterium]HQW86673.1 hypothetical protein [Flavobacteriales bacterium]
MKKLRLVVAAATLMVSLPSCRKCETCKVVNNGVTTYEGEACGNKDVRQSNETSCTDWAATFGGTCTCEKS